MIHKLKHLLNGRQNRPIFVLGTGRSGTHWLGQTVGAHPEIRATIEEKPMFSWSRDMALDPRLRPELLPKLIKAYHRQLFKSAPRQYLDKSHPNVWFAEELLKAFPDALFLGIERNPYATVASMIRHNMVAGWHKIWRQFPVPNEFLGIDEKIAETYDSLSLAAQCALRWRSHHRRMNELETTLGKSLLVIQYESFAANPEREITRLQRFLGLKHPLAVPDVKTESLDKWKSQLSPEDIEAIGRISGVALEEAAVSG